MSHTVSSGGVATARATLGAAGVATLGVVAGFASVFAVTPVYDAVAGVWPAVGELLSSYVVQPGFGVVAAVYAWRHDQFTLRDRFDRPSAEGVAWILVGPVAYELGVTVLRPVVSLAGFTTGHGAFTPTWRVLTTQPELAVPTIVVLFLVMAPMEEALYRGVVHHVLTDGLGVIGRVAVGGVLFGGMHVFLSGGVVSLIFTTVLGLLAGVAYERTDTLVVPVGMHAGYWLLFVPW